jgi:hypothetical protein
LIIMLFAHANIRNFKVVPKKDQVLQGIEIVAPLDESLAIELGCRDLIYGSDGGRRSFLKLGLSNVYFGPALGFVGKQLDLMEVGGKLEISAIEADRFVAFVNTDAKLMLKFRLVFTGYGHDALDFIQRTKSDPVDILFVPRDENSAVDSGASQLSIGNLEEDGAAGEPAASSPGEKDAEAAPAVDEPSPEVQNPAENIPESMPTEADPALTQEPEAKVWPEPDAAGVYRDEGCDLIAYEGEKARAEIRVLEVKDGWVSAWLVSFTCGDKQKRSEPLKAEHVFASEGEARESAALSVYAYGSRVLLETHNKAQEHECIAITDWAALYAGDVRKAGLNQ